MKKYTLILALIVLSSMSIAAQQFSNNNFIYTAAPQKAVQSGNYGSLTKADLKHSVMYFDGLGRPMQSIGIGQGGNKVDINLLDWKNTWTIGNGSVPFYNQNGASTENVRINGLNPFGKTDVLWRCVNDVVSDADGGWNTANLTIDKNVAYRYTVWVKRTGSQNGITYHGTQNVVNLDGTANGNPYFWAGNLPALDTWYLMVGMIQPASYSGGYSGISGVYDASGNKVINGTDFKWSGSTTAAYFRSYLYYATDLNTSQFFYNPVIQKVDGSEASIKGLITGFEASDIVTHIGYDAFGRQEKEYLPYAFANTGNEFLKTDALPATLGFYNQAKYENTINPFSQKQFETSPLNRVLKQAAAGNDWILKPALDDHSLKMDYQTNGLDEVKLYTVSTVLDGAGVYNPTISSTTNYDVGQLYKNIIKDENWMSTDGKNKTTEEFKDKEGRVVLKRTYSNYSNTLGVITATEVVHDTYYVYDNYGNLSFVLPPKSDGVITTAVLNDLCYQYKYDNRNRLVEKKLPGKGWEYVVYDKLDRPILTQDANLKVANKWMFTKYDAFNRPIYTGEYINVAQTTRAEVQTLADGFTILSETKLGIANTINGTTVYYSNTAFPNINDTNINLFTILYYDDYNFDLNGGTSATSYGITPIANVKGLATGNKVRVLGTSNWITNVIYYDDKGRAIYNYSKNDYLVTTSTVKSFLDFPGKTLETTSSHTRAAVTTSIVDTFVYDHAGRLLSQKQKVNAQADEIIVTNTYDTMGQLTSKGVGGNTGQNRLQTVDYTYNIRGWLKGINNVEGTNNAIILGTGDLFGFQINYNSPAAGTALYNGNISQTFWKTANTDSSLKNYTYAYDALNRLTNATDNLAKFNEILSYDKNGNIINLLRLGEIVGGVPSIANPTDFGTMDNLTYTYDAGNKLQVVSDSANDTYGFKDDFIGSGTDTTTDYTYDNNGNMLTDTNKAITGISYNYLNLPTQVTTGGGNINYVYDATGTKQQKIVSGITTDYAGGFIYENNVMKFFPTTEGYAAKNGGIFSYIYQYKDYLGNVRLSYGDGNNDGLVATSEIVEENNYYPFGLKQKGYNIGVVIGSGNATAQKYKFNGKELQDDNIGGSQLNVYDFGARNYDPALGRWMNIDPLAEKSRRFSPYTYALNNPIRFVDPDGMEAKDWVARADKSVYWDNNATSQSTAKSGETYLGKEVAYTSERGTTVNLHSDKSWDEKLVFAQVGTGTPTETKVQNDSAQESGNSGTQPVELGGVANAVTATNIYTEALTAVSKDNASLVMKYGTAEVSAAELTAQNTARMTNIAGAASATGKVLGGIGLGITAYQYGTGQVTGTEASVDTVMGVVGFCGPVGAAASLGYFAGKAIYEYSSGETVFEKPKQ